MTATPERSSSRKTLVVASTDGNKETHCVVNGKKVIVGVNASIPRKERAGHRSRQNFLGKGCEIHQAAVPAAPALP